MTSEAFTCDGRRVTLEGTGRSGGEGTVHRTSDGQAAKILHPGRATVEVERKLEVMVRRPPDDPCAAEGHRSIAWPSQLLFANPRASTFVGFTMPWVDVSRFVQVHSYYDPSDRIARFGGRLTWRHLVTVAHNLAAAVAAVHATGHRVGDLRETNLLVAPDGLVTLIDCDSFEVHDASTGAVFPTRVGTADYLPPELQDVDFRSSSPDRYHADLFALAVLVFRLCMAGVHPYQSRGPAVADAPSTAAKIRLGAFPYVRGARGVAPPAFAPPFDTVPASLRELFVRTFVDGHADPSARPDAAAWTDALGDVLRRARACRRNPHHVHANRSCPWCAMARDASDPFPAPGATAGGTDTRKQITVAEPEPDIEPTPVKLRIPRPGLPRSLRNAPLVVAPIVAGAIAPAVAFAAAVLVAGPLIASGAEVRADARRRGRVRALAASPMRVCVNVHRSVVDAAALVVPLAVVTTASYGIVTRFADPTSVLRCLGAVAVAAWVFVTFAADRGGETPYRAAVRAGAATLRRPVTGRRLGLVAVWSAVFAGVAAIALGAVWAWPLV